MTAATGSQPDTRLVPGSFGTWNFAGGSAKQRARLAARLAICRRVSDELLEYARQARERLAAIPDDDDTS